MSGAMQKWASWRQRDYCYLCELQVQYDKMSPPKRRVALWELQKEEKFTDVTVLLDDGHRIPAHRNVLAAALPSLTAELASGTIQMKRMSTELCLTVLEYIYTGEKVVSTDNAHDILQAARQLDLRSLETVCQNFLRSLPQDQQVVKKARTCYNSETGVDLMLELKAQCQQGRYTDWKVEVEGKKFSVHQNVLVACSPYFRAMLTQDMMEMHRGGMTLPLSLQVWQAVLDWLYVPDTQQVSVCLQDDPEGLINAAEMLLLPDLKKIISVHLGKKHTPDNVCDFFRKYYLYQIPSIHVYLLNNFHEMYCSEAFLALEARHLLEVLRCPRLQVLSEETVCTCIVNWLLKNPTAKEQDISNLVGQIRTEDLSALYLNQTWWRLGDLGTEAFRCITEVFGNERCKRQLTREEPLVPADGIPRRRGLRIEPSVYGMGSSLVVVTQSLKSINVVEWYFSRRKWYRQHQEKLPHGEISSHRAAISPEDGSVLIMALHDRSTKCCCVLLTGKFPTVHKVKVCQEPSESNPSDDFALTVSGKDFYTVQRSSEKGSMVIHRLDRSGQECRWVEVGCLQNEMRDLLAVATDKQVVVVGSRVDRGCFVEIQSFDLQTRQCSTRTLSLDKRVWFHAGVVLDGEVWFVGMNGDLIQVAYDGCSIHVLHRDLLGVQRFGKVAAFAHMNGSIGLIGGISTLSKPDECSTVHPYGDSIARPDSSINTSCHAYKRDVLAATIHVSPPLT